MLEIERQLYDPILAWANARQRKVLLLRGPRQVGKTYLARKLSKSFTHFQEINFLSDKRARSFFAGDLNAAEILEQISVYYNLSVIEGETLLFLDEIQECPEALTALRFFYEQRPNLHVIATGSLLEFALADLPSFGVGRIESLFLYPVTFDEYLKASGEEQLLAYVAKCSPGEKASQPIHEKLLTHLRLFLFLGGLPEVVSRFLETRDYPKAGNLIDTLRLSYEDDFAKYRGRVPEIRLKEVFRSCCLQAGKKFIHSHAYPDAGPGQVHRALELLHQAGIVNKTYHSSCNGVPLGSEVDNKKFKALPFDHGIYQRMMGMVPSELLSAEADPINKGALAEVYAGISLLAHAESHLKQSLFYWHRESKSSNAEVDYVIQFQNTVVPIEVKAGTKGQMQSMHTFLREKNAKYGIRLSLENFGKVENVLNVPLYAISQIRRILGDI